MEFKFTKESVGKISTDLFFVIAFQKEGEKPTPAALRKADGGEALDKIFSLALSQTMKDQLFTGKKGATLLFPTFGKIKAKNILIVGAGNQKKYNLESVRRLGGIVAQVANKIKSASVAGTLETEERLGAFVEGTLTANYQFDRFKSKNENGKNSLKTLYFQSSKNSARLQKISEEAGAIVNGVNLARDLTNLPPNILTPTALGKAAAALSKEYKNISVKIFSPQEIKAQKMGALLAVSQGSHTPPAFIHLKYNPPKKSKTKVALVGKGITFDSGGLNLKTRDQEFMKMDMAGAAAVVGIFKILGALKPAVAVEGFIPSCENMPAGGAYRPSDIITTRAGTTVEILNTDAEGRLALADALDFACESNPTYIIDMATLTGGAAYALGELYTPILGNDKTLIDKLLAAGKKAGEPAWELPIVQDYKKGYLKGPADLKNSGSGTMASTISGALFLEGFAKKNKWAHMDIASTAWTDEPANYYTMVGATGIPVKTIVYFLKGL